MCLLNSKICYFLIQAVSEIYDQRDKCDSVWFTLCCFYYILIGGVDFVPVGNEMHIFSLFILFFLSGTKQIIGWLIFIDKNKYNLSLDFWK